MELLPVSEPRLQLSQPAAQVPTLRTCSALCPGTKGSASMTRQDNKHMHPLPWVDRSRIIECNAQLGCMARWTDGLEPGSQASLYMHALSRGTMLTNPCRGRWQLITFMAHVVEHCQYSWHPSYCLVLPPPTSLLVSTMQHGSRATERAGTCLYKLGAWQCSRSSGSMLQRPGKSAVNMTLLLRHPGILILICVITEAGQSGFNHYK